MVDRDIYLDNEMVKTIKIPKDRQKVYYFDIYSDNNKNKILLGTFVDLVMVVGEYNDIELYYALNTEKEGIINIKKERCYTSKKEIEDMALDESIKEYNKKYNTNF